MFDGMDMCTGCITQGVMCFLLWRYLPQYTSGSDLTRAVVVIGTGWIATPVTSAITDLISPPTGTA